MREETRPNGINSLPQSLRITITTMASTRRHPEHEYRSSDSSPAATTIPPANAGSCQHDSKFVLPCERAMGDSLLKFRCHCQHIPKQARALRGRFDGKPALNAVELAHAREERVTRGQMRQGQQSGDGRHEEAMRTRDRGLVDAYSFD
jgi:hypothetical protein